MAQNYYIKGGSGPGSSFLQGMKKREKRKNKRARDEARSLEFLMEHPQQLKKEVKRLRTLNGKKKLQEKGKERLTQLSRILRGEDPQQTAAMGAGSDEKKIPERKEQRERVTYVSGGTIPPPPPPPPLPLRAAAHEHIDREASTLATAGGTGGTASRAASVSCASTAQLKTTFQVFYSHSNN